MKRRTLLGLTIFITALLPAVATASIIVNNPVNVQTNTNQANPVYFAQGPDYTQAHNMNFVGLTGKGSASTGAQTIYLNATKGTGNVVLMNALEIINATSSSYNGKVTVYLNGTIPTGLTMYYSTSEMSYTGTSISGGTVLNTGAPIHMVSSKIYISIELSGNLAKTTGDTLNLQTSY